MPKSSNSFFVVYSSNPALTPTLEQWIKKKIKCHLCSHFVIHGIIIDLLLCDFWKYNSFIRRRREEVGSSTNKSYSIRAVYNIKFYWVKFVHVFLSMISSLKSFQLFTTTVSNTHITTTPCQKIHAPEVLVCFISLSTSCCLCLSIPHSVLAVASVCNSSTVLPCLTNPSWLLRFG